MDRELTFTTQFGKSTVRAKAAIAALRAIIRNPFVTPFSCCRLIKILVVPVWTYPSHICANPIWYRGDTKLVERHCLCQCVALQMYRLYKLEKSCFVSSQLSLRLRSSHGLNQSDKGKNCGHKPPKEFNTLFEKDLPFEIQQTCYQQHPRSPQPNGNCQQLSLSEIPISSRWRFGT